MSDLRFSSFYFLYFAATGTLVPFWGLYLESLGFSVLDIGVFIGIASSIKIVAPPIWSFLSDIYSRPFRVVRWAGIAATLCFCGVFISSDYSWLIVCIFGFNFFWTALLPQIEAMAMHTLGARRILYGRLRLWGSVGFVFAVLGVGRLVDLYGVQTILPVLLMLYIGTIAITCGISESVPESPAQRQLIDRWRPSGTTIVFLLSGFLMQASHGSFYTFFTIHLSQLGYSGTLAGALWALGVVCEVMIFFIMHRVFARFSVPLVLFLSFLVAAFRWILLGFGDHLLWVLILTQCLHAITFGAWHAASMQFIHHHFPGHMRHRGQALHGSLCFASGSAVGGFAAGVVWSQYGAQVAWVSSGLMALAAAGLSYVFIVRRNVWMVKRTV